MKNALGERMTLRKKRGASWTSSFEFQWLHTSQERVKLDQQLQVDVVRLWSFSVTRSGVLLSGVISTHSVFKLMKKNWAHRSFNVMRGWARAATEKKVSITWYVGQQPFETWSLKRDQRPCYGFIFADLLSELYLIEMRMNFHVFGIVTGCYIWKDKIKDE